MAAAGSGALEAGDPGIAAAGALGAARADERVRGCEEGRHVSHQAGVRGGVKAIDPAVDLIPLGNAIEAEEGGALVDGRRIRGAVPAVSVEVPTQALVRDSRKDADHQG